MTIKERQEREAHDRENPWRSMSTAPRGTGLICDLLFNDMVGQFPADDLQFFQEADGRWYQIEPAKPVYAIPINWRPSYVRMTIERRNLIKSRAR